MLRELLVFKAASYQFGSVLASQDLGAPGEPASAFHRVPSSQSTLFLSSTDEHWSEGWGVIMPPSFPGGETESGRGDTERQSH